jgi:predicted enzyme related to lactoylglutathione lyase
MGKAVVHWELWSKEPEKLSEFYTKVFDWKVSTIPELNYHLVDTDSDGGIGGGIMTPQEGDWPSDMTFYIDVDDLAAYRERIVAAGGQILIEEMSVPNVGSFSLFSDPDGRVLGMWKQGE